MPFFRRTIQPCLFWIEWNTSLSLRASLRHKQTFYLRLTNFFLIGHALEKFNWIVTYVNNLNYNIIISTLIKYLPRRDRGRLKMLYKITCFQELERSAEKESICRSSRLEMFLGKDVLKICSKVTSLKSHFGMVVLL